MTSCSLGLVASDPFEQFLVILYLRNLRWIGVWLFRTYHHPHHITPHHTTPHHTTPHHTTPHHTTPHHTTPHHTTPHHTTPHHTTPHHTTPHHTTPHHTTPHHTTPHHTTPYLSYCLRVLHYLNEPSIRSCCYATIWDQGELQSLLLPQLVHIGGVVIAHRPRLHTHLLKQ